eukprot:gene9891-4226_t
MEKKAKRGKEAAEEGQAESEITRASDVLVTTREVLGSDLQPPDGGSLLVWLAEGDGGRLPADWHLVIQDWERMAEGEGAQMTIVKGEDIRTDEQTLVFGLPIEEELRYLRGRRESGPRAVYLGRRPAHLGPPWDWASAGDSGTEGSVAFPAIVTGDGADHEKSYQLVDRTNNEGEAYHVLVQARSANRAGATRAAIMGDSDVAEKLFTAVSEGGGSRMWGRDMSQFAPALDRLLLRNPGTRAYIRQPGHSLPPGLQMADRAARRGKRERVPGWLRRYGGVCILLAGEKGDGGTRARLEKRIQDILRDALAERVDADEDRRH